jgi:hypothetical protein
MAECPMASLPGARPALGQKPEAAAPDSVVLRHMVRLKLAEEGIEAPAWRYVNVRDAGGKDADSAG